MQLKDCPVPIYGDTGWRGQCPKEDVEQVSFFNRLRSEYPDSYGLIALHPRNEGMKKGGQFSAVIKHAAEGMAKGAADIVIPGLPSFVCELKRRDHTKCAWQQGQKEYLAASLDAGAFACVALGAAGAWEAFEHWLKIMGRFLTDNRLPTRQLEDYLNGIDGDPSPAIISWSAFFIHDAAKQILSLPKPKRRDALGKLPAHIAPMVETEAMRIWKFERD